MRTTISTIIFLIVYMGNVQAFEFEWGGFKDDVHQQMTAAAMKCVASGQELNNKVCEQYLRDVNNVNLPKNGKADLGINGINRLSASDMWFAVTWPDDPLRELRFYNVVGWVRWAFNIGIDDCERNKSEMLQLQVGLRCSSHYGRLQFLHAMEKNKGHDAEITRNKMLEWAKFAYQVAINKTTESDLDFSQQSYCEYFKRYKANAKSKAELEFADAMYRGDSEFPCNINKETEWKLSTIFGFTCRSSIESCKEWINKGVIIARKNALGAILHMIQDSYAMGHSIRGSDNGIKNEYACSRITQFQTYNGQNHSAHKNADKWPKPAISCEKNTPNIKGPVAITNGPVTASANIIKMFLKKENEVEVEKYLKEKVFVLTNEGPEPNSPPLDAGVSKSFEDNREQTKNTKSI